MKNDACVILFTKYPQPGEVKTRIAAESGPEAAADLARAFVEDTLDMLRWVEDTDVLVCYAPKECGEDMKAWLGEDRQYAAQKGPNLGIRMRNAFRVAYIFKKYRRVVLLGSDVPHLHDDVVRKGLETLTTRKGTCIAPAEDGGYYLIGFNEEAFEPRVLEQVDYEDKATVFDQTLSRLRFYDKRETILDSARDVDTLEDLRVLYEAGAFKPTSATYKVAKRVLGSGG